MSVWVCVYHNISGTIPSIAIKFDLHIYFWILNSGKTVIFLFSQLYFLWSFFIFYVPYYQV
ncbi:hypothetical protein TSAR_006369 [Trichomalopsis sarcophagae]|uniref:Uncharacterized protein n=1 Tax=Trichomalopsis sarcophagae TaxID=543379 RepID=A0A232FLV4_9HYME|nr:hypothetical protein TSAR_006369 [Trichomalopsis sarcophagae]